jgi:hypothetical protein
MPERPRSGNARVSAVRGGIADRGANWLSLAAAPTFAIMALLTAFRGSSPPDMLCAAAQHASPLSGMAAMYWLMSAFHWVSWLKLISSRCARSCTHKTCTLTSAFSLTSASKRTCR